MFDIGGAAPDMPDVAAMLGEPDIDLCAEFARIEHTQRQLDARRARVVAALDKNAVCDTEHGMRTGAWISHTADLPKHRCNSLVRVSTRLIDRFPILLTALETAAITWHHIEAIIGVANPRIIDQLADLQTELIVLSQHTTFDRWILDLRGIAEQLDADGGHNPNDGRTSKLRVSPTLDGAHHLNGTLTAEHGLPVAAAITKIANELFQQASRDHTNHPELPMPTPTELSALALVELCRRALSRAVGDSRPPIPEITVVINTDTGHIRTVDGITISTQLLQQLAPEAMWRYMHTDRHGAIIKLGRTHRLATKQLRHALNIRDGGCTFPGCNAPHHHTDVHHIQHWEHGGTTDQTNCALLCRYHHGITHRNGWTMHKNPGQWFHWTTPTGRTITSQRHGTPNPAARASQEPDQLPPPNRA